MRHFSFAFVLTFCMLPLQGATLERLSLNDMIQKSTAIVRGTITGSHATQQGRLIYTHYAIQVTERYKGTPQATVDLVVPGGVANNVRQTYAGAPVFHMGEDYVFFLWTGKSGLTQIIGLTQGLFAVAPGTGADRVTTRAASQEIMLEPGTGRQIKDQTVVMNLSELRSTIAGALRGRK